MSVKRNSSLMIRAVSNGFEVFSDYENRNMAYAIADVRVFETLPGLLAYMRKHFDAPKAPAFGVEKKS